MATEIASAYISLIPSFQGGAAAITSQLGGPSTDAGREAGNRFGGGFSGALTGVLGAGALLGGMALVTDVLQQSITEADLPGTLRSQFALSEADAAAAAKAAGAVYTAGFGESLSAVGTTAGTVQKALNDLGQTGNLNELTTQAQALSDKFGEEVGPTITSASQLVKTGLAPNMDAAFDLMTKGFQSGANSGQDFLDTITEYSTKFRDLGIDGQTAFGLINQAMEAGARNSDLVADALKEFSIRAIDGSKLTAEGFQAVGLDAETMASKIAGGGKGAADALDQTLDALRNIEDPVARDAAAVSLFGTQAEDLGDALYAMDPSDAADKLGKVGGAAEKLSNSKSAASSMTALGRAFKDELGDAITPLVPLLTKVFDFLKPLLPILAPLALAIGVVAAATWVWNSALLANPIVLIIAAIIAAAALVIVYWDEIVAALTVAWEWLAGVAETVWNAIVGAIVAAWEWIVGIADSVWTGIVEFFSMIWDGIVAGVTAAWDFIVMLIVGYFTMMFLLIETVLTAIVDFFVMIWDGIVAGVTAAWDFIVSLIQGYLYMMWLLISTVINTVVAVLEAAWAWITETVSTVWNGIVSFLSGIWDSIVSGVQAGVQGVLDFIGWLGELPGKAAKWFGGLLSAAVKKFKELVSWAKGIPGKVLDALGNVGSKLLKAGKDLIGGLLRGLKNAWGAVKDWILDKLSDFKDTVLNFFGISSPSKLMMWVGEHVVGGFTIGMDKKLPDVASMAEALSSAAIPDASMLSGAVDEQNSELVGTAVIDLGEGIQRSFEIKWERTARQTKRAALAGSGRR